MLLKNKTILITGGCGSFGQKFTEIILKKHKPKSVRIYDNRELAEVEMKRKFNNPHLRFFVGDVRDRNRLYRAMNGIDIVVHTAALKHVPVCEYNPIEAVKTNIEGAINVIDAAIDNSIKKVMAISTDKAVHPVNLYGATKMVAEKLFIQGNSYTSKGIPPIFSCTRYGNVIASSGSVIPLFKEQKKNGKITITDKKMTRFWMTLEQGIEFVIKNIERMQGGEIFVPKIPSMKIMDLANTIAPDCRIKYIGVRPGEKIHECLITENEAKHTLEFDNFFVIIPEFSFWKKGRSWFWKKENQKKGKPLPDNFKYTGDNNKEWLTKEQMRKILKGYK